MMMNEEEKEITDDTDEEILTTFEAAKYAGLSYNTIKSWAKAGAIPYYKTPGGHWRIRRSDLDAFLIDRGIPVKGRIVHRHKRVLIVDDEVLTVKLIHEFIEGMEETFEIEEAFNGFEAGRLVQSFKPDIVILDIMMPGLDGYAVCTQIKGDPLTRNIDVIAITGYHTPESVERIQGCGASMCLKKPLDLDELKTAILNSTGHAVQ
jgi:excisionase family DNA binding protein